MSAFEMRALSGGRAASEPTISIVLPETTESKVVTRSWKDFLSLIGDSAAAVGTFALLTISTSTPTRVPNPDAGREPTRATWIIEKRRGRRRLTLWQARELALAVLREAEARRARLVAEEAAREAAMAEIDA